ncbi:MacB family efflux pump subunit [Telmatospirillum sp. J64-1]|uniref:MacB family efflux pump subunit n=1 Tax=Telmatospirillum sp. J64-1 TaxID=2502183 RepID=UPI00115D3684|nr:MacB family efflux pump subunit [Telmatospirillum sp. J64-1]
MTRPLISLRDITKSFRRGGLETQVLHGISLDIYPGEFVAILGASGSGKSTLMNILGCLDRPSGGHYLLDGQDVAGLGRDALARLRRDVFGFVFQQYNLLPTATAVENVEIPAIYAGHPRAERQERARSVLERLGLGDRLDHRPSQLSGGQQQRVSIARALINGGRVILADEPTGALDSRSGREVMDLLRELNAKGHTVILITHDADVAKEAKRRIRIADGLIVSDEIAEEAEEETGQSLPPSDARNGNVLSDMGEAVRMAFRSMRGNIFRTILTLLGIVIGVGSVIAMLAIGDGAKKAVIDNISAMGTDLLLVRPGAPNMRMAGASTSLTPEDAIEIGRLPGVAASVPEINTTQTLRADNLDHQTSITATSSAFPQARNWRVAQGVFFDENDTLEYAPVAVLGGTVAQALFPDGRSPLGRYILIRNVPFQVIGVLEEKGASPQGMDQDDMVLVPLSTGQLRLIGQRHLRNITVQVEPTADMNAVQESIESLLLARHGRVDFQVRNMAALLESVGRTQDTFRLLLGSIAAISLLVGGIGVMNIMLVSVTERTREIGIRMATGARGINIQMQFLTEALVVCCTGGLLGVAGGLATGWLIGRLGSPVEFSLTPVLVAFFCAAGTGLVFGFLPARKAARLDPVVALASD